MQGVLIAAGGWEKYAALVLTGCAGIAFLFFGVLAIKNRRAYVSRKGRRMLRLLFKTDEITGTWAIIVGGIQILSGVFVLAALGIFVFIDSALNADKRLPNRNDMAERLVDQEEGFGQGGAVPAEKRLAGGEKDDAPDDSDFEKGLAEHRARAERFDRNFSSAGERISSRFERQHQERMEEFDREIARRQREPLDRTPQSTIGPVNMGSMMIEWQEFGRRGQTENETRLPDGSVLVGVGYALSGSGEVDRLVGIFQSGEKLFYGAGDSEPASGLNELLVPDGSVVGSIRLSTQRRNSIAAVQLRYGELSGGRVELSGEQSDWIGEPSGEPMTMLDGNGHPIVALAGTLHRAFDDLRIGVAVECDPPLGRPKTALPPIEFEYTSTERVAGDDMSTSTFDAYDMASQYGILVGFRVAMDERTGRVGVLQPVYHSSDQYLIGTQLGGERLRTTPNFTNVIAEDGYAVGGCELQTFGGISSMTIQFARIDGGKLDLSDAYTSDHIGSTRRSPREPIRLDTHGQLVVGVISSARGMRGFGLVTVPESAVTVGLAQQPTDIAAIDHEDQTSEPLDSAESLAGIPAGEPDFRTWTSTSGKTVTAKFIQRDGDRIVLETEKGKRAKAPLLKLSQEDRDYVDGLSGE